VPSPPRCLSLAFALLGAAALAAQPPVSPAPRESETQKLLDQIEQLKKELAAKKGLPPSGCAVHARIEKRGETSVAALKLTYTFRTATPNAAVALAAKRSFLVAAKLDGQPLPTIEGTDTGFTVVVDQPGNHTVVLDVECPIGARGTKPEIGFELGMPRAAITSLIFEPPPGVTRVALTTRTPDGGKAGDPRRVAGIDAKSVAPPAPMRDPYPLGPVESLEVSWEPPVATPTADATQSAELDATVQLNEAVVETTAKFKLRGTSRTWHVAAPPDATFTADRVAGVATELPVFTKPADAAKPVWKVELPAGTVPADWIVTAVIRAPRAKPTEPAFRGPFAIGPLSALDVAKLSGALRVVAPANTRLSFKHGRELRPDVPPAAPADDETIGFFRLAAGPIGNLPPAAPLLTFEATPLAGRVAVRPNYKLQLADAGWNVRAELRITPIRTTLDSVTLELPASWRGVELAPPTLVNLTTEQKGEGDKRLLKITLTADQRQPFDLVLTASAPFAPGSAAASIPLPRFPGATERDTLVSANVPDGIDLRGAGHEWDNDQPSSWTATLPATPGPDGKAPRNVTAINGKFERGLARLDLAWSAFRPPLTAEVRADLTIRDSQIVVSQRVQLRSADGLPRTVRFAGAAELTGLAPFDRIAPGVWLHGFSPDAKDGSVKFEYAIPLPANGPTRHVPVGLVLPLGTSRTDIVTRIWVASHGGRAVSVKPGPWREIPPEPSNERDALPAFTLAASGDVPLALELRDAPNEPTAAVTIDRALLQATHADDATAYRARFVIRRWFGDSLDVKLPAALDSVVPEVYLDEPPKRIPGTVRVENGERILRVPLPEAKVGRTVIVDLRYSLPSRPANEVSSYPAPEPVATFGGPVRWQIAGPAGTVPLLLGEERAEQRWRTRFGLIVPLPAAADDLEKWLLANTAEGGANGSGETAVLRLRTPGEVAFLHLPRVAFIIGVSVATLLLGLILSRLPGWLAGPAVAVIGAAIAIAATLYPQPASQTAAAAEPGFATLLLVLAFQTAARWYHRRRVTYLPGFTRSAPTPTSGGSRPSDRIGPAAATGSMLPQSASTGS